MTTKAIKSSVISSYHAEMMQPSSYSLKLFTANNEGRIAFFYSSKDILVIFRDELGYLIYNIKGMLRDGTRGKVLQILSEGVESIVLHTWYT
jgi:hypothetical protein